MTSGDDLRDAARLARECMVMGRAVALGQWIGTSARRVTAGQGLRKAAVPEALRGLCDLYDRWAWERMHAVDGYFDWESGTPLAGVVALLAEFGAVTGDVGKPVITPLGRWAAGHLSVGLPALADPGLPV